MKRTKIAFSGATSTRMPSAMVSTAKDTLPRKTIQNNIPLFDQFVNEQNQKVKVHMIRTLHAANKPAVRFENGDYMWYLHGQLHREGGPAVYKDGVYSYYRHGKLHREGGPAILYPDGRSLWFIDGIQQPNASSS